jgi:hypothetical protein
MKNFFPRSISQQASERRQLTLRKIFVIDALPLYVFFETTVSKDDEREHHEKFNFQLHDFAFHAETFATVKKKVDEKLFQFLFKK